MSKKYAFLFATFRAYAVALLSGVLPRLLLSGFRFAQPFLITDLVSFIGNKNKSDDVGKGIIGAYALVYTGRAVSNRSASISSVTDFVSPQDVNGLLRILYQQICYSP
jgi:hypothetical protein